ncbi:hypothetical protein DPMN_154747 [Dreissena polymorpha]|uniref:Perilipin n=1 Tax=Dreissena polymorpha TaxID=45954 RepID=A0A9D4FMM2_DREPO|nr:hypothetical protein DPMN_154747 [Dreissena polymorpha]
MYRQSLKMERGNEQFITRLASLPVVSSGIAQVYSAYQKTKDYNGLLRSTCNMAETGLQTMVSSTMPYVEKYKPQLDMVNSFACQKLSMMEEQYPIITRPTDELIKEGMDKCASLVKPVTDRVSSVVGKGQETIEATKGRVGAVKEYGVMTLTRTLDTPLAKYAMEKVNEALTVSEDYVEKYLPAGDDEAQDKGAVVDEVSALTRVSSLSSKLRQRMYKRAMRDLSGLQMRSKEQLEKLNFTVDLIQYAKSSATEVKDTLEEKYEVAQRKMADYWEQINEEGEEEEEEGEKPMTLEGRTLMVARRVTRQMKTGFATVSGYMPVKLQPTVVRERMENALNSQRNSMHHSRTPKATPTCLPGC